jgi:phenylacetate-CoA ligase
MERLNAIVRYAFEHSVFYRESFSGVGYSVADTLTAESFRKLPLLRKRDIQSRLPELVSDQFREEQLIANQTGGSTGEPLKLYHDRARESSRRAATLRHNEWAGVYPGSKIGILWGAPRDFAITAGVRGSLKNRLLDRTLWLNASEMSLESLKGFADEITRFKPDALLAYANTLYLFAQFLESEKITPPQIGSVITSAEPLTDEARELITRVFRTEVFNRYGCRELSIVASECSEHDEMHVNAEHVYHEILTAGEPSSEGQVGELVLTDLSNRGMPLIRYQIEDSAAPVAGECACRLTLPRIQITGGRVSEFLVTAEDKLIAGTALTIFLSTAVSGVAQMQLYQREKGEVTFRIVRSGAEFDEALLREKAGSSFGPGMRIGVEYVESIPRETSGKYRFSISEVASSVIRAG